MPFFRTSRYTVFLMIFAAVVFIVNLFYDPLERMNMYELMFGKDPFTDYIVLDLEDGDQMLENAHLATDEERDQMVAKHPVWLYSILTDLLCPIMSSMGEFYSYMVYMYTSSDSSAASFAAVLIAIAYLIVIFLLERLHWEWHENEEFFTVCVDMTCVEIIAMFFFELCFSFVIKFLVSLNIPDVVWILLTALLSFILFGLIIVYFCYLATGIFVSLFVPLLLLSLVQGISEILAVIVFLLSMLVFSRVVWNYFSDRLLNFFLEAFSRGRFSLAD